MRVVVLGAGSWGTTVAALAAGRHPTVLWARDEEVADEINDQRTNHSYLPGFTLPPRLTATAELAPDDVVVGVDAEQPPPQHPLQGIGDRQVLGGDHAGRGLARHDLLGQVRAGERRRGVPGEDLLDHLRHAQERALLQALREADHRDPRVDRGLGRLQRGPEAVRGHPDDQHLGLGDGLVELGRGRQTRREGEAGQVAVVGPLVVDLVSDLLVAGPQHGRMAARGERGHRRAPRSCSQHHNAHVRPPAA